MNLRRKVKNRWVPKRRMSRGGPQRKSLIFDKIDPTVSIDLLRVEY